jgi:tRNA nucleotidyltransferase (CCA-adding enzyme)
MRLITTHLNADIDGVASMLALARLEPGARLFVPGAMDPTAHRLWHEHEAGLPRLMEWREVQTAMRAGGAELLVVDTADPARLGSLSPELHRFSRVQAWDTHPPRDGELQRAALPAAGACVAALVLEMEARGLTPPGWEAGFYLVGIHVDTGNFSYPNTTALDHRAAAICLDWGAPPDWPSRYAPLGFTREQLALMQQMARGVEIVDNGGLTAALVSLELDEWVPDLSVLLGALREAEGWPAAVLVSTAGGGRLSLIARSAGGGGVKVNRLMERFGGGGHPEAASATLNGVTLSEALALVREALAEGVGPEVTAGALAVSPIHHAAANATIAQAADLLHRHRVNALPLNDNGRWVGLVTRREVDEAVRHGLGERPAMEISTGAPSWLPADLTLEEARQRILEAPQRLVMVGSPPTPLGILTRTTVLRRWASPPGSSGPSRRWVASRLQRALGPARTDLLRSIGAVAQGRELPSHLVGGGARDLLMDLPLRDVDVVVEGYAPELGQALVDALGGELHVHDAFGTAHWLPPDSTMPPIDLASARSEVYRKPGALPEVAGAGLRQDLYRRDFTLNAMAVCLNADRFGELTDPYGGWRDLQARTLRVLHGLSFHDDPSRAWRAARFAARLDFSLSPETRGLLDSARRARTLETLGRERLGNELDRILEETEVVRAFRLMREWDLLVPIHPALKGERLFLERLAAVRAACHEARGLGVEVAQSDALWLVVAAEIPKDERPGMERLVPGDRHRHRRWRSGPEQVKGVLTRLRSKMNRSRAGSLIRHLDAVERTYALGIGRQETRDWLVWWEREGRHVERAIGGEDLKALGYTPGPIFREALDAALKAAWDGGDKDAQLAAARKKLEG